MTVPRRHKHSEQHRGIVPQDQMASGTPTPGYVPTATAGTEAEWTAPVDASAHIADATDAHDASAISFDATGLTQTSATEVQQALEDLDAAIDALTAGTFPNGTSFPGSPSTGDVFHRTDKTCALWRYDGARWRCTPGHEIFLYNWNTVPAGSSTSQQGTVRAAVPQLLGATDHYLLDAELKFYVNGGTALGASHKWVVDFAKMDSAAAETIIGTVNINSGASSTIRTSTVNINALLGTTSFVFTVNVTKTGTPGPLIHWASITYQHVAT